MKRPFLGRIVALVGGVLALSNLASGQGYPPEEAAGQMSVAEGLAVRLVAAEPMVRQPVALDFDDRGRLWVIQYLQYPNPAGLERVEVDRYSRTVYDRVPEPPPHGPRGADRITILEDTTGDGVADTATDFLDGLNLATGLAFGHDGVYVLQVPYLLFYPDRDRDDVPDGDPEVLLSGFGMEDAHSVANSLTWGPDGWLYGLQGSTVTAHVRGIRFQQGVWRYHPITKEFELFAEGGGNMWGLDFDRRGQLLASTNVGGSVMLHMVQGAYYWKAFGKHGPLRNPYTFGYFDHVPHQDVRGGHVTVGGLFYEADAFPPRYRGAFLGADLLDHSAHWHTVRRFGSTFQARQEGDLFRANDTWFAPSAMALGPDGFVYVADWHDQRTAHPDPDADWDKTNGRIFALTPARPTRTAVRDRPFDLRDLASPELVALLDHPNVWYVRKARRILTERRDTSVIDDLRHRLREGPGGVPALEALWTLYGVGGFDEALALTLLDHDDEEVRAWTVRLIGDHPNEHLTPALAERLVALAEADPSVVVRAQLACSAQRLPATLGLELSYRIARRDEDGADPFLPLLVWWAVERHATAAVETTLQRFASDEAWAPSLIASAIQPRLLRRYAAERSAEGDAASLRLLTSAPEEQARRALLATLDEATRGRRPEQRDSPLAAWLRDQFAAAPDDPVRIRLAARAGDTAALDRARRWVADPEADPALRQTLIDLLGERADGDDAETLLALAVGDATPEAVQIEALRALGRFHDEAIAHTLIDVYLEQSPAWRARARELLLGRASWARAFLGAIDAQRLPADEVPVEQLRPVAAFEDEALDALVRAHWGTVTEGTPEAKLAEVRRLNNDLRAGPGDPQRGRALFDQHCASCHTLFGQGGQLGPDLTHANRGDRQFLLVSLVDPSATIRREYQATIVETTDGRILTGLITDQTPSQLTLRAGPDDEPTTIAVSDVEAMHDATISLMPEDLYRTLSPQDLRDLFAYLEIDSGEAMSNEQ